MDRTLLFGGIRRSGNTEEKGMWRGEEWVQERRGAGGSRNQWCACEPAVLDGFRFAEQRSIGRQPGSERSVLYKNHPRPIKPAVGLADFRLAVWLLLRFQVPILFCGHRQLALLRRLCCDFAAFYQLWSMCLARGKIAIGCSNRNFWRVHSLRWSD